MTESKQLHERIKAAVNEIWLVNSHDHFLQEPVRNARTVDLFSEFFSGYPGSDLVSAGLPEAQLEWLHDVTVPLDERWAKFAPYWERVRHTAYARTMLIAAKGLFGIDEINEHTYAALSRKIAEANTPGWYHTVLKDKARIELSVVSDLVDDDRPGYDPQLVVPVTRCLEFFRMTSRAKVREYERTHDIAIRGLDTLVAALKKHLADRIAAGIAGIKMGQAYGRPLRFERVTRADAERVFNRVLEGSSGGDHYPDTHIPWPDAKPLHDFLIHKLIGLAEHHGLPVQIHTGLHAGNGNYIVNSKPTDLANLFFEYPKCRFDIFHGAYPYCRELGTLAKNFPNVYVDMCWMHVISPSASCAMLHEWLDMVPESKILGFGGDHFAVEGVYANAEIAREHIACVLAERVEWGWITEAEAAAIATKILRTNAAELFGIELQERKP